MSNNSCLKNKACNASSYDFKDKYHKLKGLINNQEVGSSSLIEIKSPIDNEVSGSFYGMKSDEIDDAYEKANEAFKIWSKQTYNYRKDKIIKFAELLDQQKEELANLLTDNIAKAYNESLTEITRSVKYIYDTISVYEEMINNPLVIDETIHKVKNKTGKFIREPLGVVLNISPWNYPLNTPLSKMIPTLIAGNTVVYKVATQAAIIGIKLAHLFKQAGFDPGVVQCVVGLGREIGDKLNTNKHIKSISFTGSTPVGLKLLKQAAVGNISLELGGKDAALILSDYDKELTIKEIIKGAYGYSGQRCTAIKRVLIKDQDADEFVNLLKEQVKELHLGNPFDNPSLVPVIDKPSADYIKELYDDAISKNAIVLNGGDFEKNWIDAILLDHVTKDMRIAWEEPFGPILPIIRVKNEAEMIKLHNDSEYGLQASIFTSSQDKFDTIANQLEAGTINWNRSSSRGPDFFPFLGVKDSGVGVQGIKDTILSVTRYKGFVYNR
ncbi:NADP-dependent glyceraldehyde-3-phosphate dehydrogenase [Mycoplasma bradburyae]|uniref:NADP-dependent glyceraldehyde-3-phosphate dehydrogenase n=1 Tax=Mycoplasma bradburyae TaxID=2963128 RepID=A0AAW6HPI5_9MOLU|nr:NADP-dependent glyceraldehyde-3-phosphate dehydrogenase [Mycoplasma bradburyae]MDC4183634.1 NADP-dependent glyceraldehyde-3-phosphate dehydrogenase [Mycoplasma bradburyae]